MKNNTKELIINTAINLIQESHGNPEEITIRDISKEAGIAVSQINYHFQTKDNLLSACVQKMVHGIIQNFGAYLSELEGMERFDKLERMLNLTYTYLYDNENLARISILSDHRAPSLSDNTNQTLVAYMPLIRDVCAEKGIANSELLGSLLIQTLQGFFLRTDILKKELEIDLRKPVEREMFIHNILEKLFQKSGSHE